MTDAATLHASLLTLDTHVDIPWPTAVDPFEPSDRLIEFPKMVRGGLGAACIAAYVPQGPRTPESWAAAGERALAMLDAINAYGRTAHGIAVRITPRADDVTAAHAAGAIAIIPVVENGHAIGQDLGMLGVFRARGARYMTLTHNGHNALADSSNPRADLGDAEALHGGLSPLGREAVQEMNRIGMLVDISHVSKQTAIQAAMLSKVPVVATHSCIRALCDVPRNIDDQTLDALRDTGGMVNITAVPSFVKWKSKADVVTVADYCDHIDYVVQRIGLAHCGISSDFDGGGGFSGWRDASESGNLTAELLRRGYGPAQIAALWGGNFLRLLRQAEDVATGAPLRETAL